MMPWSLHCKIREELIHQKKGTSQSIPLRKINRLKGQGEYNNVHNNIQGQNYNKFPIKIDHKKWYATIICHKTEYRV